MLVRTDPRRVVLIGQPSHAWISGQLARAWGNEHFGAVEPFEEVCLAAEQHDIGMATWDVEPPRNPESGLPVSFLQMAIRDHIELWTAAPRRLLRQSRYAALLVSLHARVCTPNATSAPCSGPSSHWCSSFSRASASSSTIYSKRCEPTRGPRPAWRTGWSRETAG